jgi:predicted NBD/HSP70 family sugar kinase
MDHFAGLDVSVKDMSVCIVDDTGKIVREVKVASPRRCWRCGIRDRTADIAGMSAKCQTQTRAPLHCARKKLLCQSGNLFTASRNP